MAIGLSSRVRQGPDHWEPFIHHALDDASKRRQKNKRLSLAGLDKYQDLEEQTEHFSFLAEHLRDLPTDNRTGAERNRRETEFASFCEKFLPLMMVARRNFQSFRGERISAGANIITVNSATQMGTTRDYLIAYSGRIGRLLNEEYQEAYRAWDSDGSQGQAPNRNTFINQRLRAVADTPGPNSEFEILIISSCFPAVAELHTIDLISQNEMLVGHINQIATPVSRLLFNNMDKDRFNKAYRNQVTALLEKSPFWRYSDRLRDESRKFEWVKNYIQGLLRIARNGPTAREKLIFGPEPLDGSGIRHALIFSETPISAFLIFMLLWKQLEEDNSRDRPALLYVHSGVGPGIRAAFVKYMEEVCDEEDSPVKILISPINIMGEGFNYKRVNTVILTEIPKSPEIGEEAFARINSVGQVMKPLLYQLYDRHNLADAVRRTRNRNQQRLARSGHDGEDEDLEKLLPDLERLLAEADS
jgi:hypothetical protein